MRFRQYVSITAMTLVLFFGSGCMPRFAQKPIKDSKTPGVAPEIAASDDVAQPSEVSATPAPDTAMGGTPADARSYGEEEATLSAILNLYEEALAAMENDDYGLAETRIESAAVLSSGIELASIGDESLVLRYMNTLASIFQDYGRIFRNNDNDAITYVIRENDTLYEIALKNNVSYRDIMRWNKIENHRKIRPGQKIIIKTEKEL